LTQLQSDLFVKIATMGWLSGLENPIEWYVNYCRSLDMWCRYEDVEQKEREATECMISFFFENGKRIIITDAVLENRQFKILKIIPENGKETSYTK